MQVCSNRLLHFLKLYRVAYSIIDLEPVPGPQEPAAALQARKEEMAESVLLQGKEQCYLAVLPSTVEVNFQRFANIVGEPVRLAMEERIRDLFPDCELGAIPPFGRLYGVPTYVDEALAGEKDIVFLAGMHSVAMRMGFADYQDLARLEVRSFAVIAREAPVA